MYVLPVLAYVTCLVPSYSRLFETLALPARVCLNWLHRPVQACDVLSGQHACCLMASRYEVLRLYRLLMETVVQRIKQAIKLSGSQTSETTLWHHADIAEEFPQYFQSHSHEKPRLSAAPSRRLRADALPCKSKPLDHKKGHLPCPLRLPKTRAGWPCPLPSGSRLLTGDGSPRPHAVVACENLQRMAKTQGGLLQRLSQTNERKAPRASTAKFGSAATSAASAFGAVLTSMQ